MDLTVAAVPFYFASMGAEAWWLKRNGVSREAAGERYQTDDTIASLAMGVGSLVVPLATRPLLRSLDVTVGRRGKVLLGLAGGAALGATAAGCLRPPAPPGETPGGIQLRSAETDGDGDGDRPMTAAGRLADDHHRAGGPLRSAPRPRAARRRRWARRVSGSSAVAAVAGAGAVVAGTWANRTVASRLFERRLLPDWGSGVIAGAAAILGWDFIYYWNHRFMHETRFLWAIHVVHHSSRHYNLSTALRQPVADALGTFVPYGLLALAGIRPEHIERARGINLIYQYWIHTEVIRSVGPLEKVLNTPSHHRVHHGSNSQYLAKNHGSILIVWDRLFGTFEPESEAVAYGLTRNIDTFNPLRIATHEYADMISDVSSATNWADRVGFVIRGPGWAYRRREANAAPGATDASRGDIPATLVDAG